MNDNQIWETAKILLRAYGADVDAVVQERLEEFERLHESQGALTMKRVQQILIVLRQSGDNKN